MSNTTQEQLSSEDQKKYKEILLKTMESFDNFCKLHRLKYVGAYGTVLGAIRHNGLIPWDDDIDVYMMREDYEKFLALRNSPSLGNYEIVDDSCKSYALPYAKFCDAQSTIWEREERPVVFGVFIDVFPVDFINDPANAALLKKRYKSVYRKFIYTRLQLSACLKTPKILMKSLFCKTFSALILRKKKRIESLIKEQSGTKVVYFSSDIPFNRTIMPCEWLQDTIDVPYEHLKMPVPRLFDEYLKMNYGDYMTPPPPENRQSQHFHFFIDLEKRLSIEEIQTKRI